MVRSKIKKILEEANRYNDIIKILMKIVAIEEGTTYPVNAFSDNEGKIQWRVESDLVIKEAIRLLRLVNGEDTNINSLDDVINLYQYVHSYTDILLHNYSVSISHRIKPKVDIDVIRNWEILDNLISCLGIENDEEGWDWYIPNGWKKTSEDTKIVDSNKKEYYVIQNPKGKFFTIDSLNAGYPCFISDFKLCEKYKSKKFAEDFLRSDYATRFEDQFINCIIKRVVMNIE